MTPVLGDHDHSHGSDASPMNSSTAATRIKTKVCKFWLRGDCTQEDDQCPYLHEKNPDKTPRCPQVYANMCPFDDCVYKHVYPANSFNCPYYERGCCTLSKDSFNAQARRKFKRINGFKICRLNHVREYVCPDYLIGFCPKGPKC